jgi:hypothetical protein
MSSLPRMSLLATGLALGSIPGSLAQAGPAPQAKYGPVAGATAVPLSQDNTYLRDPTHLAPDFWALVGYYVPQFSGAACSVATVAMIVNAAIRAGRSLNDVDRNVTQADLLDKVDVVHWKDRVSTTGYFGQHGLSLAQLKSATEAALTTFGAKSASVEMVEAAPAGAGGIATFRAALAANEKKSSDFLIVHFLQNLVTGAPGGPYPHISPIGAYDEAHRRVLLFDVDRDWYEPYWVADETLWRAMTQRTLAFGSGGYLWIKIAPP